MLQIHYLSLIVYSCPVIAYYFCIMKRFLLITIGLIQWASNGVLAQFNTVTQSRVQTKVASTQQKMPAQQPRFPESHHRDSILISPQQNEAEQTDRLPVLVSPLRQISVTCPFGWRTDPFTKRKARHNGLDLKAYYEPAYAMTYGEVVYVGKDNRSGLYVTLRHGDFTVSYCHLSKAVVTKGAYVHPGSIVALTGNSGRSTGPHLHITLRNRKNGQVINPSVFLNCINSCKQSICK